MIFLETSVEFWGLPIASWLLEAIPDAESGPTLYKGLDISCIDGYPANSCLIDGGYLWISNGYLGMIQNSKPRIWWCTLGNLLHSYWNGHRNSGFSHGKILIFHSYVVLFEHMLWLHRSLVFWGTPIPQGGALGKCLLQGLCSFIWL